MIVLEKYQLLYYFNLMVDGFRWVVSDGKTAFNMTELTVSVVMIMTLCILGILHFRKTEKVFADVI